MPPLRYYEAPEEEAATQTAPRYYEAPEEPASTGGGAGLRYYEAPEDRGVAPVQAQTATRRQAVGLTEAPRSMLSPGYYWDQFMRAYGTVQGVSGALTQGLMELPGLVKTGVTGTTKAFQEELARVAAEMERDVTNKISPGRVLRKYPLVGEAYLTFWRNAPQVGPMLRAVEQRRGKPLTPDDVGPIIEFGGDILDPLTNLVGGKVIEGIGLTAKALKLAPRARAAFGKISTLATRADEALWGPVAGMITRLGQSPMYTASIRAGMRVQDKVLEPARRIGRALNLRTREEGETVADVLRGASPRLIREADEIIALRAELGGDTTRNLAVIERDLSMGIRPRESAQAFRQRQAALEAESAFINERAASNPTYAKLKRLEDRFTTRGIDPQFAETVVEIAALPAEERAVIDKLAKSFAAGETVQESILARLPEERLGSVFETFGKYLTAKSVPKALKPGEGARAALATDPFIASLPQDMQSWLRPTPESLTAAMATDPQFAALPEATQDWFLVMTKLIDEAKRLGAEPATVDYLRQALAVAASPRVPFQKAPTVVSGARNAPEGKSLLQVAQQLARTGRLTEASAVRKAVLEEAAELGVDPHAVQSAARLARTVDDRWGRMMVSLGNLTEEQYLKNKGTHIRREYEIFNPESWDEIQAQIETLAQTDTKKAAQVQQEFENIKGQISALGRFGGGRGPVSTGVASTRKDLSPEMRAFLGEWENLSDSIEVTGAKVGRAVSAQSYMNAIHDAGFYSDVRNPATGFTVKLTNDPKAMKSFGPLGDKYVTPEIEARIKAYTDKQFRERLEPFEGVRKLLAIYKQAAVVQNPMSRLRNAISNTIAVTVGGGDTNAFGWADTLGQAMLEMKNRGPLWRLYDRYSPSLRSASIGFETTLRESERLAKTSMLERVLFQNPAARFNQQLMGQEESLGKMMLFIKGMDKGLDPMEAVTFAERWMVDYLDVPPWVDWLRRTSGLFPFLTYTYKMAGNLAKAPITSPRPLLGWAKLYSALNDEETVSREFPGLPDWMRNGIPIRLPGKEARYFMADSFVPWNIFEAEKGLGQALSQLGPPYKQIIEVALNQNVFTGGPVWDRAASLKVQSQQATEYLAKSVSPQTALGFKLWDSLHGVALSPKGKPQKWWEVALAVRNLNIDEEARKNYQASVSRYREATTKLGRIARDRTIPPDKKRGAFLDQKAEVDARAAEVFSWRRRLMTMKKVKPVLEASGMADPQAQERFLGALTHQPPVSEEEKEAVRGRVQQLMNGMPGNIPWEQLSPSSPTPSAPSTSGAGPFAASNPMAARQAQRSLSEAGERAAATPGPIPR